jgi:hypothetical protein
MPSIEIEKRIWLNSAEGPSGLSVNLKIGSAMAAG